jgi:UDPglucose 6-dehydrogenase
MKVGIVGKGYLGTAYSKMFADAVVYDKHLNIGSQDEINSSDIAIVAVPTDPLPDGSLDMSIVESVVDWLETDLILIKSALMPGTVDRLVKKTGKNIAVSLEMIGMGKYYLDPSKYPDPIDPQKHQTIIVGGELETATRCAEVLWDKMSPNIRIHLLTAKEVEMAKLIENAYGALKVTFVNCMYDFITKSGGNFIRTHQAWTSDSRVDGVHMRTLSYKRGWKSHCWSKDIPALQKSAQDVGEDNMAKLMQTVIELNNIHYGNNK